MHPRRRCGQGLHRHHHPGLGRRTSRSLQEINKTVYDAGKGNLEDQKRFGSVYYNLGVVNGILNVEAVRIAQAKFGKRTLTGEEVRWGFENLQHRRRAARSSWAPWACCSSINAVLRDHEGGGA